MSYPLASPPKPQPRLAAKGKTPRATGKSKGKGSSKQPGQKRTRTGCLVCRSRKHKCGEEKIGPENACQRCIRAGLKCVWPEDVPKDVLFRPYPTAEERAPPPVRDASPSSSSASISYMPMLPLTMSFPDSSLFGMHLGEDESSFGGSQLWVAGLEPDITYPPTPLSQTDDLCFGPAPFVDKAEWLPPEEQLKASPKLYIVPSSPLELTFPNPEERALAQHFLVILPNFAVAIPTISSSPGRTTNPQDLDLILPSLDVHRFLSIPRGSSTSNDALSLSILALASIHLSYLHHSSALEALLSSQPELAAVSLAQNTRYSNASNALVSASIALIRSSMLLINENSSDRDRDFDFLTGAAVMCVNTRCLAGGGGFRECLALSHEVVRLRGGPGKLLAEAQRSGDKKRLRRTRSMLEQNAVWEVFSSLSSGLSPETFSDTPISSWLFAYSQQCGQTAGPGYTEDWDTLATMLGMSRAMFELLTRVSNLYSVSHPAPPGSYPRPPNPPPIDDACIAQARELLLQLELWREHLGRTKGADPSKLLLHESRIYFGDLIWVYSLEIVLRLDILSVLPSDPVICKLSRNIVELVSDCHQQNGLVLGLIWPCLIAGGNFTLEEDRVTARAALEILRSVCCFDLDSAFSILIQVWALRDSGYERASWRDLATQGGEGLILF